MKIRIILIIVMISMIFVQIHNKRNRKQQHDEDLSELQQLSNNRSYKSQKRQGKNDFKTQPKLNQKRKTIHYKNEKSHHEDEHAFLKPHQLAFWWNTLLAIFLSCAGGFCSGMTVGLNSLDKLSLQVQQITGSEQEKKIASRILNTISDHHLFLVTLLIGNAMVLEWLPLVVHKIMPDWAAILISTVAVVIVAEIVPMSATTGPQKVLLAYMGAPLVDLMIKAQYIIAYPIARGLDKLLGVHDTSKIKRRQFLALVNQKKKNQLQVLQIGIINQVFIGSKFTSVQQIMKRNNQLFSMSLQDEISQQVVQSIREKDVSFIFVLQSQPSERNMNFIIIIKTKQLVYSYLRIRSRMSNKKLKLKDVIDVQSNLVNYTSTDKKKPNEIQLSNNKDNIQNLNTNTTITLPVVYSDTGLLDILFILNSKCSHIALVHKQKLINQNTNLAYLDADDYLVHYDPLSEDDRDSIIGAVFLQQVIQSIADFSGEVINQDLLQRSASPPKKRRLVKRASIMSSYSSYSMQEN